MPLLRIMSCVAGLELGMMICPNSILSCHLLYFLTYMYLNIQSPCNYAHMLWTFSYKNTNRNMYWSLLFKFTVNRRVTGLFLTRSEELNAICREKNISLYHLSIFASQELWCREVEETSVESKTFSIMDSKVRSQVRHRKM